MKKKQLKGAFCIDLTALDNDRFISASVGKDVNCVCIWDVATGTCLQELPEQPSEICSLATGPANCVAIGLFNGIVRIYNVASKRLLCEWKACKSSVKNLLFISGGNLLIRSLESCGDTIRVWNQQTQKCVKTFADGPNSFCALPDGRIVAGLEDGSIRLWDGGMTSGTIIAPATVRPWLFDNSIIYEFATTPTGDLLVGTTKKNIFHCRLDRPAADNIALLADATQRELIIRAFCQQKSNPGKLCKLNAEQTKICEGMAHAPAWSPEKQLHTLIAPHVRTTRQCPSVACCAATTFAAASALGAALLSFQHM